MRFQVELLIITCLLPLLSFSQQRWYSSFGRQGERENSVCISESYDKGYLISGQFYNADGLIAKTNTNGELLWDKVYVLGNSRIQFYANGILSSGRKVLAGYAGDDPVIVSLDACGDVEWCYTFKNQEHFWGGAVLDLIVYEDGHALAMVGLNNLDWDNLVYLFNFDPDGNLTWMKRYAKTEDDPDLGFLLPFFMDTIDTEYFVSGYCYYRRNDNPDVFTLRPMFIKIDEDFNEEWLLPYGQNIDSFELIGDGFGVMEENDSIYRGYGRYFMGSSLIGAFLNFSADGFETDYVGIPSHLLNDSLVDNSPTAIERINDTLFMAAAIYGFSFYNIAMGEYIVSSSGNVYGSQFHPNTTPAFHTMVKTDSSQFVFAGEIKQDEEWDMFLYKLNDDLSSADYVNDTITYDYLCDNLPIVSDTIDLSACGIITGMEEIPTPGEYYASLQNIPINVQPNPANDKVKLEIGNMGYKGYRVWCYNTSGQVMYESTVGSDTEQFEIDISQWQSGIYIIVVTDGKGKKGSVKFVVE